MTLSQDNKLSYAEIAKTPPAKRDSANPEKSCVKVVVRVRPENKREKDGSFDNVVRVMNENVLVFDPKEQGSPHYGYKNCRRRDIRVRIKKDLKFAFDFVFGPRSTNAEVYQQTTKKILSNLLDGYNCSVFAYGATGAGKTHTMLGNPSHPGVMFLTMVDLYQRINAMQAEKTCDIAVSYLEVYNEQINDLLMGGKGLPVRENASSGIVIQGLSLHKPTSADELLYMLQYGNERRTQHPTDANAESSRSHAVLQIFVRQRDRTANISTEVRVAKLCMVDLAGSERATVTKNRGKRFREGANINRSLLALGNVINALADTKFKGHVPYRDSKLTRILKDSLGGNCQTVMIAAVSPSSMTFEDTYNTLKYADRAKHIEAQLKKNVLNVDFHVSRYQHIVEELRTEIVELKGKLQLYEEGKLTAGVQVYGSVEVTKLKEKLDGLYCKKLELTSDFLKADLKSRDLKWKVLRKEKCLARPMLVPDHLSEKYMDRVRKVVNSSKSQIDGYERMKSQSSTKLDDVNKQLQEFVATCQNHREGNNRINETVKLCQELHQTKLELTESEYKVHHLTKVIKYQEREIMASERLLVNVLLLMKKMKHQMSLTSDLEADIKGVQTMIEGREVSFADQEVIMQNHLHYDLSDLLNFKSCTAAKQSENSIAILKSPQLIQQGNRSREPKILTRRHPAESDRKAVDFIYKAQDQLMGKLEQSFEDTSRQDSSVAQSLHISCTLEGYVGDRSITELSNSMKSEPCEVCKLYSCTCKYGISLLEQPCRECKLFSCTCSNSAVRYAGHTPACKNLQMGGSAQDLRKSAILSQATKCEALIVNRTNSIECGKVRTHVTTENSEELNSTFTLEESKISDPTVRARTPVIKEKFSRRTDDAVHQASQSNLQDQFSLLPPSPENEDAKSQTSERDSTKLENSSLNSTFSVSNGENSSLSSTVTKSQPSVTFGSLDAQGSNLVLAKGSSTVTKRRDSSTNSCHAENEPPLMSCVEKENSSVTNSMTPGRETCREQQGTQGKSHCVRGLQFEENTTPSKSRTWADVVMTPPSQPSVKRPPLRQVNNNSADDRTKENIKKLQKFGIPSVYNTSGIHLSRPSYMQPTKAVKNRTKFSYRQQQKTGLSRPGWQM